VPVNGSTEPPAHGTKTARHLGFWVRLLDPARYLRQMEHGVRPRFERLKEGESFVGAATAIGLAIALQYSLPDRVSHYQRWIFPIVAGVLLVALLIGHRGGIHESKPWLRGLALLTVVFMALANGVAAGRLIRDLLVGEGIRKPGTLLLAAGAIWLTNVIVFALGYWLFDRGGPAARFLVKGTVPDFLFPQHVMDDVALEHWDPVFFDYFYTSFTNATAFSPTDVMPLTPWAKFAMTIESALSLMLAVLVIARAVNILK
jgi:hypothetical protein